MSPEVRLDTDNLRRARGTIGGGGGGRRGRKYVTKDDTGRLVTKSKKSPGPLYSRLRKSDSATESLDL